MNSSKLRVGIAGLGFGAGVHLPVFKSIPDAEVCAVLGQDREKTAAAAARHGVPAGCTAIEEFLDRDLDAIVAALPPGPNGVLVRAALERGLAVLSEKPMAAEVDAAAALARVARDAGRTTMVDFEFRELNTFQALKDMIASGRLGRIHRVQIAWRVQSYAQRRGLWNWKSDAARGGGVLTLSGLHLFHLIEWLFGPFAVERARLSDAMTRAFAPSDALAAIDTADLVLRTADGLPLEAQLSNAAATDHGHRWAIEAAKGHVMLDDGGVGTFAPFTLTLNGRAAAADPARDGDYRVHAVARLARRFLDAARARRPADPDFEAGVRAQAVIPEVLRAAAQPARAGAS